MSRIPSNVFSSDFGLTPQFSDILFDQSRQRGALAVDLESQLSEVNQRSRLQQTSRLLSLLSGEQVDLPGGGKAGFGRDLLGQLLGDSSSSAEGSIGQPGFRDEPGAGVDFSEGIANIQQSREAGIAEASQDALNSSLSRLEDRGLGGSSFVATAEMGAARNQQALLNDLAGDIGGLQIQGEQAELQQRAAESELGFRRQQLQSSLQQQQSSTLLSLLGGLF